MNFKKVIAYTLTAVLISGIMTACSAVDGVKVMVGLKNNDFEYIRQNKVKEITIQSTRDPGYRFVVSDQGAIGELYDVLSSAGVAYQKSSLDPDYILEMDEGDGTVHKFKYLASEGSRGAGNLYSDTKIYSVSKRIDNDIIKNFWNIRKPKNFENIYYNSLIDAMGKYFKGKDSSVAIGVNLKDDVEVAKFILSADLVDFQDKLSTKYKSAEILKDNVDKYNVIVTIKTQGYKSTLYKAVLTFWDKNAQTEEKYYIFNKYENGGWDINITKDKPQDF